MKAYKVFYKEKWIELAENQNGKNSQSARIEYENGESFKFALKMLETREGIQSVTVVYSDPEILLKKFLKFFKRVNAAGGLVENEKGQVLIIFRNGRWDLPKGKLKRFENEKKGAIREVKEECGVDGLRIDGAFSPTYHMYELKGKMIVKKTWWYLMHCNSQQNLSPQIEEGITKVEWFEPNELTTVKENTYGAITQVLKEYEKGLNSKV
jgi:8-oxo-dGTP pyrophosphatase MutT (NUDIX family)